MPNKRHRAVTAALLPLALLLTPPGSAGAQSTAPSPLIQITPQQASSFAPAFTALAQQAHVTVVAEDQPLHPALTPQAIAGLKLDKNGEPLSTLLPRLAATYDYDVQPSGKVFLLKKHYTDAADLPSVTVKECVLGLQEVNQYVDAFNPHFPPGNVENNAPIRDLIYSLTPEQIEAMKDIHQGVPVASLSPEHQQEVRQFILHIWIQKPSDNLPSTVGALSRVAATDPRFSWRDYPQFHVRLFGYDATLAGGRPIFVTMSKIDQIQASLDGGIRISPRVEEGVPQVAGYLAPGDITDPLPAQVNAPKPAPVSSSLAEIVARLNARAADGLKGDGLKVTVEPYLAPKRAAVFGEEAVTPRQEVGRAGGRLWPAGLQGRSRREPRPPASDPADGASAAECAGPARLDPPGPARPAGARLPEALCFRPRSTLKRPSRRSPPASRRSWCTPCGRYGRRRSLGSRLLKTAMWRCRRCRSGKGGRSP